MVGGALLADQKDHEYPLCVGIYRCGNLRLESANEIFLLTHLPIAYVVMRGRLRSFADDVLPNIGRSLKPLRLFYPLPLRPLIARLRHKHSRTRLVMP